MKDASFWILVFSWSRDRINYEVAYCKKKKRKKIRAIQTLERTRRDKGFTCSLFLSLARGNAISSRRFFASPPFKSLPAVSMSLLMNRPRRHTGAPGAPAGKAGPTERKEVLEIWIDVDWANLRSSLAELGTVRKISARWIGVPETCFDSRRVPR